MLRKQLAALGIDGITIRIMIETVLVRRAICKKTLFERFNSIKFNSFIKNVSITLIDKTDRKNPKKREEC